MKRHIVTPEDQHRTLALARSWRLGKAANIDQAVFVRQHLKVLMGWEPHEKTPKSIILASKTLADILQQETLTKLERRASSLEQRAAVIRAAISERMAKTGPKVARHPN